MSGARRIDPDEEPLPQSIDTRISLDDWFAESRKDLLKLAAEFAISEEVDSAIALLQAERALMHAQDVMSENGIDGSTPFEQAVKE